jgi:hypothetical protein
MVMKRLQHQQALTGVGALRGGGNDHWWRTGEHWWRDD